MRWGIEFVAAALLAIMLGGCGEDVAGSADGAVVVDHHDDGRVTITDRTGKVWDVTHASRVYGLVPEKFQFGIGPNAILPVFDPVLVSPGDAGFPAGDDHLVLGVEINGEARAYSIRSLSSHEVVNEVFGDAHVAVAY